MEDAITAGADTTVGADPTVTAGAGGDFVVVPLLAGVGAALSGFYTAGKLSDNVRFWNDYYKATGYKPKYPWRAGVYDPIKYGAAMAYGGFGTLKNFNNGKKYVVHHYYHRRY